MSKAQQTGAAGRGAHNTQQARQRGKDDSGTTRAIRVPSKSRSTGAAHTNSRAHQSSTTKQAAGTGTRTRRTPPPARAEAGGRRRGHEAWRWRNAAKQRARARAKRAPQVCADSASSGRRSAKRKQRNAVQPQAPGTHRKRKVWFVVKE